MTLPTSTKSGTQSLEVQTGQCSLGTILVAISKDGVCMIALGDDPDVLTRDLKKRFPNAKLVSGGHHAGEIIARIAGFIEAPGTGLDIPLDVHGTAFQQRVWQALREIPAGATVSYTEIAKRIGAPKAVRAVAGACATNPLAVAIPCHRVIRADGKLSGYRWGAERKTELLRRESQT